MIKKYIFIMVLLVCTFSPFALFSQNVQEIEIVIGTYSATEKMKIFETAEDLRVNYKFRDAIEEYKKVISGEKNSGKESEALYNIGLCYTWLQDFKEARKYFVSIIESFPEDHKATAYAEYGLSWIDTKEGNYAQAIKRLEQKLSEKNCPDKEHNAIMQFQIGRIYMVYLKNQSKAKSVFRKILDDHPYSKIRKHPYIEFFDNPDYKMVF